MIPNAIPLLLLLLLLSGTCAAAEEGEETEVETPMFNTPVDTVDTTHETMSDMVESMAKGIDRFFAADRAFEEDNDTSVQISLDMISEEDDVIQFDSRVRTKLALPGTERRLRLIIESDPEEIDPNALQNNPIDALNQSSNYIIGLEGERIKGDWQLRPSLGIKPKLSPEPYARYRAIRYFTLDSWLARFSGTAAWFSSDGKSLAATTDFDRKLSDRLLFRASTSARWEIDNHVTSASEVLSLYRRLSTNAKLAYDLGIVGNDEPDWRALNYFLRLRYRRLVYKTWAYVEIQPMVEWPEVNDFHEQLSLLLRLEMNFGKDYH